MNKNIDNLKIIKNVLSSNIYLLILIGSILGLFLLPILGQKIIVPSFYKQMEFNILDEAKRVGEHIARHQDTKVKSTVLNVTLDGLKDDFKIVKIKLFDKNGYIVFSTDSNDIGAKNSHPYFYNVVANGNMYHKIVNQGTKTLEDKIVQKDVAEIYVPIIKDGVFTGASEIYYDITEKKEAFNKLISKVSLIYTLISFILWLFILIMLYSASKTNLKEKQKDEELKQLNNLLQDKVDEQTKELMKINTSLEIKIKEEIEKSREKDTKLFHQSKMAAMGEMIGNIAHQWRQPLSAISSTASSLQVQKAIGMLDSSDLDKSLENIIKSTNYLSNTIEDFRNFFKSDKAKIKIKFVELVDSTLSIISTIIEHNNIKVVINVDDIIITTLPNEFKQAVLNILNNSIDALKGDKNKNLESKYIFIKSSIIEEHLKLIIYDNAGGIQEEIIEKIFEPYYTTKHKSQGTGIGLYMTREIISKHLHGDIVVKNINFLYEDKQYNGAEFTINLKL